MGTVPVKLPLSSIPLTYMSRVPLVLLNTPSDSSLGLDDTIGFDIIYRGSTSDDVLCRINNGSGVTQSTGATTPTNIADNKWHYIVCTFDRNGNGSIYIDGKLIDADSITSKNSSINVSSTMKIGSNHAGSQWYVNRSIDSIKAYNYLRSKAQIVWEYNKGAPINWYKFDECQGTTAYNYVRTPNGTPAGINATITIGASGTITSVGTCAGSAGQAWADGAIGKINGSIEFDGSDDYASIADSSNTYFSNLTVSAWIKAGTYTGSRPDIIVEKRTITDEWSFYLNSNRTLTLLAYPSGISTTTTSVVSENTWTHVTGVIDSINDLLIIYINGKEASRTSYTGTIPNTSSPINIGRDSAGSEFLGQMDDLRFYDYPLNATQIKDVSNNGAIFLK